MPKDKFTGMMHTPGSPATSVMAVVPSDTTDLAEVTIALNVATPGALQVTMLDGTVGNLTVEAGLMIPVRVRRVWETGTTATGISALF